MLMPIRFPNCNRIQEWKKLLIEAILNVFKKKLVKVVKRLFWHTVGQSRTVEHFQVFDFSPPSFSCRVKHPNILQLVDVYVTKKEYFLFLEL